MITATASRRSVGRGYAARSVRVRPLTAVAGRRTRPPPADRAFGALAPVRRRRRRAAAAVWAAKIYIERLKDFVDGAGAPNDLSIFLHAAGKVLHAASPYAYDADKTFAYPPFAAWLVAPLHPLSSSAAGFVWTLLSLAMVALALWLLELRDWRCYGLAFVFLFTRSSIDLGTIEPPLLLAVAAAWRWRDRPLHTAVAIGTAIVLKFPLAARSVCNYALPTRSGRRCRVRTCTALVSWQRSASRESATIPACCVISRTTVTSSYSVVAPGVRRRTCRWPRRGGRRARDARALRQPPGCFAERASAPAIAMSRLDADAGGGVCGLTVVCALLRCCSCPGPDVRRPPALVVLCLGLARGASWPGRRCAQPGSCAGRDLNSRRQSFTPTGAACGAIAHRLPSWSRIRSGTTR